MSKTDPYQCFEAAALTPPDNELLKHWHALDQFEWPLDDDAFADMCDFLSFSHDMKQAVIASHQALRNDEHKERIARLIYKLLSSDEEKVYYFPTDKAAECKIDPLLNVPVFVHAAARLPALYQANQWSEAQCRDTLSDLALWIEDHAQKFGVYGFKQMDWCRNHWQMRLLKVGRLQFEPIALKEDIRVLRNRESNQLRIINAGQQVFCEDGLFATANTQANPVANTVWQQEDSSLLAHAFDPQTGHVLLEPETFDLNEWELIAQTGDRFLSVHIPATGPLTIEACAESCAEALPIFNKHFKDAENPEIKGLHCSSWLLNPHFAHYLKPTSNMVQFMRCWHLFAKPKTTGREFFYRVWGKDTIDIETAPQATSLQRAVIKHIQSGQGWNDMGGIIMVDELPFGPLA